MYLREVVGFIWRPQRDPHRRASSKYGHVVLVWLATAGCGGQSRGIVIAIPPMTSLILKSRFGLRGWLLWQLTQAVEMARSA
jgi:hypothetical protein